MYQHVRSSVRSFARSFSKSFKKRRKSSRAKVRRDFFAPEALESRVLMANNQDLVAFAQALTAAGVKMYGADWCPHCTDQKALFEDGAKFLNFIEITNPDQTFNARADEAKVNGQILMPTWVFADGSKLQGEQTLQALAAKAGVAIPTTNVNPSVAALNANNQVITAGSTIKVKAGSPLWIPLDGFDPNGGELKFEVVSSNPSVVNATVSPTSNQSARITVQNFGEMVFQLFDHLAPRPSTQFETLANQGFYNSTASNQHIVHRVSNGANESTPFVIQMGDPTNDNGTGGSSLGNFDDQFSLDLQHNRRGLLSYAKSTDDTNDSQFFVTAGDPRFLDFNHSIFGVLVEGESTRAGIQRIDTVKVNAFDPEPSKPFEDVVVERIDIFNDTENSAMLLKAVSSTATSGTSEITVRVRDEQGNVSEIKFNVEIEADTENNSPFITNGTTPLNFNVGDPIKFTPTIVDAEGNTNRTTTATVVGGGNATVNATTGEVTVTPPSTFTAGQLQVRVRTHQNDLVGQNGDPSDTQVFTLNVTPGAPTSISLLTDTGLSTTDRVTNGGENHILTFVVSGIVEGAEVKLFANGREIATADESGGTATFNVNADTANFPLGPGVQVTATQSFEDTESPASTPLSITYDPLILDFTTAAPTTAEGNVPFIFDANNPEEGQSGFRYRIIGTLPAGMQFDTGSGEITWTPQPSQLGTHSFTIQAEDLAGNTKDLPVTLNVTTVRLAQFLLVATDLSGNVITGPLQKGQEFFLEARVKDLRPDATGVEAAFLDVAFDSTFATITGTLEHGDTFTTDTSGTAAAGSLDEVGGKTTATNLAGQTKTLFRIKMRATKVGELSFALSEATADSTARTATSSGSTTALDASNILFTGLEVNVVPNFSLPAVAEFEVDEDSTNQSLDVLAQATKGEGVVLTLQSTSGSEGTVTIVDNKLRYTAKPNFFGEDTFSYVVRNAEGDELTGTITVVVSNVNDPPVGTDDTATIDEDSDFITINVLANDTFAPDPTETLRIKSVGTGDHGGTIQRDAGSNVIRYKPASNFFGVETFTYVVEDGNGGEDTVTVRVTVTEKNDPPTANPDSKSIGEDDVDIFIDVLANDSSAPDPGETLEIIGKTNGSNGTVKLENGRLLYTPNANFRGVDTFTYTIRDSRGQTSLGTVTVQVADENDPPVAIDDAVQTPRGTPIDIAPLANDSVGGDTGEVLRITSITQPANGKATLSTDGKTIKFEPNVGFTGTTTFTYTVSDPLNVTDVGTITVTVLDVAPSDLTGFVFLDFNGNGRFDDNEAGLSGVEVKLSGKDQAGATVSKTATTDINGRYRFENLDPGEYDITETQPAFIADGRAHRGTIGTVKSSNVISVKITSEDTHGFNLNFSEQGRKPQFIKLYELFGSTPRNSLMAAVQLGQSATTWTHLGGTAWDGFQNVSVSLSSDRANVIIDATSAEGTRLRSTVPVTDKRVRLLGKEGTADLVRLFGGPSAFNLQPVGNTSPTFTKGANQTVLEDAAKQTVTAWAKDIVKGPADEASQTIAFDVFIRNGSTITRTSPLFEEFPAIAADGTLTFKSAANANGTATLVVVAKDNGGTANGGADTSAEQTFTITITAVNDAPSFTKGADQTVAEDAGAQTVNGFATNIKAGGGEDENSQTLTFDITVNNQNLFQVQPTIDATGKLTYTPKANTTGTADITVRLRDNGTTTNGGVNQSAAQVFKITVTGANDPPVAGADTATTTEGTATSPINVLANDSDPDGDTLTLVILTAPPATSGTAVVNTDKTITFTPAGNFNGTATFTYELRDGNGGIAVGNVTVTVTSVNDAPVAVNDSATTTEDTPVPITVLTNDTDADGDTLTVTVTDPANGTATVSNGVVTYTPDQQFDGSTTSGIDTFQYTINDGKGGTATATVTVTITSVNDAPDINDLDPADLVTEVDTEFVFEGDALITITDPDAGTEDLEVELAVSSEEGTLSLATIAGLEITTGSEDGLDDTQFIFRGTVAEIAAALNGLIFTPAPGFTGEATVLLDVSDLGNNGGNNTPQTASAEFVISVEDTSALSALMFDDSGFEEGVDDFMNAI